MKFNLRTLRITSMAMVAVAGMISLLRLAAFLLDYEGPASNYFANDALFPKLSVVLALSVCAIGIFTACLTPKELLEGKTAQIPGFVSIPPAIGFFAAAAVLMLSAKGDIALTSSLFLGLAGVYCLLSVFPATRGKALTALLGFSTVIACILLDALYYFDKTIEMNAPLKVSVLIGVLFVMLYYTGELRISLDRALPRTYLMYCFWALGIGAVSALPVPLAYLFGVFTRKTTPFNAPTLAKQFYHPEYLVGALVALGTLVGIALRLYWMLRSAKETPADLDAPDTVADTEEDPI